MKRALLCIAAFLLAQSVFAQQVIKPFQGGTGVSQPNSKTITLGGPLVTSGAFSLTISLTNTTSVTFPTTGTLSTLAGSEELTTKTLTASVGKGTWTASGTWTLPAHTINGLITLSGAGQIIAATSAGAASVYGTFSNTSGSLYWTIENSSGGSVHTGVGAYESAIGTSVAKAMHIIVGNSSAIKVGTASLTIANAQVTSAGSGTRFLCISTAGVVTSSASACSGT